MVPRLWGRSLPMAGQKPLSVLSGTGDRLGLGPLARGQRLDFTFESGMTGSWPRSGQAGLEHDPSSLFCIDPNTPPTTLERPYLPCYREETTTYLSLAMLPGYSGAWSEAACLIKTHGANDTIGQWQASIIAGLWSLNTVDIHKYWPCACPVLAPLTQQ